MTDEEFDAFVSSSVSDLEAKQAALTLAWGLGTHARYLYDAPTGTLSFMDDSGRVVSTASVVPIGSYASGAGTWMWSWANESTPEPLRKAAVALRTLAQVTGMSVFESRMFAADPEMPWELSAMSVHQLDGLGCYRVPGPPLDLYLAILDVHSGGLPAT